MHLRFIASTSQGFVNTDPHIIVDPYTSKSGEIMRARCEKINKSIDHDLAHTHIDWTSWHNTIWHMSISSSVQMAAAIEPHSWNMLAQFMSGSNHTWAALMIQQHDIPFCVIRDGANNNSNIAIGDEVKAQHAESLSTNFVHTITNRLSQCERMNL